MNIFFSALGIQSVIGGKKNSFDDLPISDGKTASHQENTYGYHVTAVIRTGHISIDPV